MCNATVLKTKQTHSLPTQRYLWIKIESLQRVDDQGVLGQPIIHDRAEAIQERGSIDNGLVVGIVETLEPT